MAQSFFVRSCGTLLSNRVPQLHITKSDIYILLLLLAAAEDYRNRDCLFVAILSHGDDGHIYGVDRPITYDELMEPLKSSKAKTLIGKPKLFVIQVSMCVSVCMV